MSEKIEYWESDRHWQAYTDKRSKAGPYKSEEYFIKRVLRSRDKALDVGCACGGYFPILQGQQPDIAYQGVDISAKAVDLAQKTHPTANFRTLDASQGLPFGDREFDYVQCLNVQVHVPDWRNLFRECWRVSKRDLLFDIRLLAQNGEHKSVASMEEGDVPYIFLGQDTVHSMLAEIRGQVQGLHIFGYYHPPQTEAIMPPGVKPDDCCMTILWLSRGPLEPQFEVHLPDGLLHNVGSALF